jgi:hypothetical protein
MVELVILSWKQETSHKRFEREDLWRY